MEDRSRRQAALRVQLAVAAAVLALATGLTAPRLAGVFAADPRLGPGRWLVADRDEGALVVLDQDLLAVDRWEVPSPVRLAARPGGGTWVVGVPAGNANAMHELRLIDARGHTELALAVARVLDLACDEAGRAVLLLASDPDERRIARIDARGGRVEAPAPFGARALAVAPTRLGVAAGASGFLVLGPRSPAWTPVPVVGGRPVLDCEAAAERGWWLLCGGVAPDPEAVVFLDADLRAAGVVPCRGAEVLARPAAARRAPWVLGDAGRWACRVDPDRLVRGAPALLAAIGAERAVEDEGGGLLVAAPGVILRLGPLGAAEPGQGGFVYLADLVRTQ